MKYVETFQHMTFSEPDLAFYVIVNSWITVGRALSLNKLKCCPQKIKLI